MKRLILFALFCGMICFFLGLILSIVFAGDKEDLQARLDKLVQQKNISGLALENAQLKAQIARDADAKVMGSLNALAREIEQKGFVIQQRPDGIFEVAIKPAPGPPEKPSGEK